LICLFNSTFPEAANAQLVHYYANPDSVVGNHSHFLRWGWRFDSPLGKYFFLKKSPSHERGVSKNYQWIRESMKDPDMENIINGKLTNKNTLNYSKFLFNICYLYKKLSIKRMYCQGA